MMSLTELFICSLSKQISDCGQRRQLVDRDGGESLQSIRAHHFFDDEPVRDFKRDTTTPAVTTLGNNHIMQGLAFPEQSDSLCLLPFWVVCSVHRESFRKRSLSINRHGRKTLQHGNQRSLQT